jgi:hypothetical protein
MTSPLTFSFPLMKSFCALALPATRSAKVASVRLRVTAREEEMLVRCVRFFILHCAQGASALVYPRLTTSLLALGSSALAESTGLLKVDVPGLLLAGRVLEVEGEDGTTLLDGVLAVSLALESGRNGVEGSGGGECVY